MKFLLRFLKPLWKLCLLTVFCIFFDIAGALYIPTLAADMLNAGTSSADLTALVHIGIKMAVASLISGAGAILGSYVCAILSGRLGKDIRDALYQKTLKLSVTDFKHFGTASVTTRTIADITNIQMSVISFIQMALPVPIIFALSAVLTFQLDAMAGWILLVAVVIVLVATLGIMRSASPLFRRCRKFWTGWVPCFWKTLRVCGLSVRSGRKKMRRRACRRPSLTMRIHPLRPAKSPT